MAKSTRAQANKPRSTTSHDHSPTDDREPILEGGDVAFETDGSDAAIVGMSTSATSASVKKRKRTSDIVAADKSRVRVTFTLTGEACRRLAIHEIERKVKAGTYVSQLILANVPDYVIARRSATDVQSHEMDTSEGVSIA
jgi:hypothetical protein